MKLNSNTYFSKRSEAEFISVSQFKKFKACPASAMACIRGEFIPRKSIALQVGSYVDAAFEGTLDDFKANNPDMFKRDGSLKSEFERAELSIARAKKEPLFVEYMSGRKQVIMTGLIASVPVKIKIDSLCDDKIVDLKCMRDFKPIYVPGVGKQAWFESYDFDLQGAVYQEIVRQNTGKKLPFYLAAVTKEEYPDVDIVHIGDDELDIKLAEFADNVPLYDAIKKGIVEAERCERCDYCKQTKKLTKPTESREYYDAIFATEEE